MGAFDDPARTNVQGLSPLNCDVRNNAESARLLIHYTMDAICKAQATIRIEGSDDGSLLKVWREISQDVLDLVAQTFGSHHQHLEGAVYGDHIFKL